MKIVITGASGNVGTALLRALRYADDITEVVAVARRVPRASPPPPYDIARWVGIDVAAPQSARVVGALASVMEGASAVIHLAWIVQPNHKREVLFRTNVLGTAHMLAAAQIAGVGHVVVASSVGAYSPCGDDAPHDETWPTGGIATSEYSVDKAAVERLLDEHEGENPQLVLTRLRPALIFQRGAGAQVMRNFMLPAVPTWAFGGGMPLVPIPAGMSLQAVHADDVAQAYLAAVRARMGGAFNIAADDVVDERQLARLLARGREIPVPRTVARGTVWAAWKARAVASSPGWLDMADAVPRMSTARAKAEFAWAPRHSALETIDEVFQGMAAGAGEASPPLRPL